MSTMDIHQVLSLLPHRYPFLLIDRVVDYKADQYLIAYKHVTVNEPFFAGHFPTRPVMPGVLIVEAMAQATGLLAMKSRPSEVQEKLYYFVGINKARFKRTVEPGDRLDLEVHLIKVRQGVWVFDSKAEVEGELAAAGEIMCTARDF